MTSLGNSQREGGGDENEGRRASSATPVPANGKHCGLNRIQLLVQLKVGALDRVEGAANVEQAAGNAMSPLGGSLARCHFHSLGRDSMLNLYQRTV